MGFLAHGQDSVASADPVLEFLSAEVARTYRDVHAALGVRGEHVRRAASAADLLAAHLRSTRLDLALDDWVRTSVEAEGLDGAAVALLDRLRADAAAGLRGPLPEAVLDASRVTSALEEVRKRGCGPTIRSWRWRLDRLALAVDRQHEEAAGRLRVVPASLQKPGDDFQGLPDPGLSQEEACRQLEGIVICCNLAAAIAAASAAGVALAAFLGAYAGLLQLLMLFTCRTVAE